MDSSPTRPLERSETDRLPLAKRPRSAFSFESRILLWALATGLPGILGTLILLWSDDHRAGLRWTVTALLLLFWWGIALTLRDRVVRPLQTLSNLLNALREGDFSLRARQTPEVDALGEVMHEINALGDILREQRLGVVEATALLHRVMEEVDVAVFAFGDQRKLQLVNRAGERLLDEPSERLLDRPAEELGLAELLDEDFVGTVARTFPSGPGRWDIRRSQFREGGLPHQLLVISDVSQTLREEERQAWKRLIRVLGHELNNSLAPIHSMASTLGRLLERRPADWEEDMRGGLEIISGRSEALTRFMAAYARLARLPPPRLVATDLSALIRRVAALETRLPIYVERGPEVIVQGDPDQLEQLLINLVRNAVDATLETAGGGGVGISWRLTATHVEVRVEDEGHGLSNSENLFVPFYTTKPGGSGIGLALSRQIAEAHGGTLTLENRAPEPGCEALLRLPV
jgi:nitrogen fixation/metabolism regulation signal transduction histidine kinase